MSVRDDLMLEIRGYLDTWAPNCGAPRAVFEGHFRALMKEVAKALESRHLDYNRLDPDDVDAIVKRAMRT